MGYSNIIDPTNGRLIKTNSVLGKTILNKYIRQLLGGSGILRQNEFRMDDPLLMNIGEKSQQKCGTQWGLGRNKEFSQCIAVAGLSQPKACKLRWFIADDVKSNECMHMYMLICKIHSVLVIKHRAAEQLWRDHTTPRPILWTLIELGSKMGRSTIMTTELTDEFNTVRNSPSTSDLNDEQTLVRLMGFEKNFNITEYNTKICGETDTYSKFSKTASRGRKCMLEWKIMKQKDIRDQRWTLDKLWGLCNQFLNTHPLYSPICLFHTANCQSFTAKMWGYISGKFTMEPIRKYSKLYKGP
tara:strand:- start:146 stop:1042 length:897 start_codon:yes stop_codon:yes gene_type:complete